MPLETPIAGALVTQQRAKDYLLRSAVGGVGTPAEQDDFRISEFINYATGQIEMHCARKLLSRAYTDIIYDGCGTSRLRTKEWPVTTVTAVRERYKDGVTSDRTIPITGYQIEWGRVIYLPIEGFPYGRGNIELDYTAGYLAGTHDREVSALRGAALRWIEVLMQDWKNAVGRGVTIGIGGESVSLIDAPMPADVKAILAPFRRIL